MIKIGLIAAAVSTAICVFLWFRDVRRIMLEQLSTVESAKSQLDSQKLNSDRAAWDPKAAKVLERSESIYRQSVCLYNAARKRLWTRFPAFVMGFDFISEDEFEPKPKKPQKEKYIGSVRFFKNLILAAVIIMIAIPTAFAVRFADKLHASEEYIHNQQKENEQLILNNEQLAEEVLMYAEEARLRSTVDPSETELWELFKAESPYSELYPEFKAPQELNATVYEKNVMYLTFDDGPSERTGEILDILKEKDVKATFFVVGSTDEEGKEMLRRIVNEGHTLGMHTYTHRYNDIYASVENYLKDMNSIFVEIKEATGFEPTLFRFPGGSINAYNGNIYQELISEMLRRGFVPYDWNMANSDAITNRLVPADELVANVLQGIGQRDRGIVLMHDSEWKTTTVEALGTTIDGLREKGFELKALTPDILPLLFSYDN